MKIMEATEWIWTKYINLHNAKKEGWGVVGCEESIRVFSNYFKTHKKKN